MGNDIERKKGINMWIVTYQKGQSMHIKKRLGQVQDQRVSSIIEKKICTLLISLYSKQFKRGNVSVKDLRQLNTHLNCTE